MFKRIIDYVLQSPSNTNPAVIRSVIAQNFLDTGDLLAEEVVERAAKKLADQGVIGGSEIISSCCLLEETELFFNEQEPGLYTLNGHIPPEEIDIDLDQINLIVCRWDDKEYQVSLFNVDNTAYLSGNAGFLGFPIDSGEPFFMAFNKEGQFSLFSKKESAKVEIYLCKEQIKPIDKKYIPNNTLVLNLADYGIKTNSTNEGTAIFSVIDIALKEGKDVYISVEEEGALLGLHPTSFQYVDGVLVCISGSLVTPEGIPASCGLVNLDGQTLSFVVPLGGN